MARSSKQPPPASSASRPHFSHGRTKPAIDASFAAFQLEIRPSKIHRWGVYALERIPPRRKVMEYTGEKISRRETKRRGEERDLHYLFTLNDYWTIDGSVGGSGAEFINHSCEPNVVAKVLRGHILYVSKRSIEPGEELLIDYRFGKDAETISCACGAPKCRGTINLCE
ncbi:MAG: SET domain-containing protein-lysine N-methyltransferase [Bryobacterales bacterium]|nr:SET domain-containing protein-lysine N-methyltransferase [Bryobacterales bacterium]